MAGDRERYFRDLVEGSEFAGMRFRFLSPQSLHLVDERLFAQIVTETTSLPLQALLIPALPTTTGVLSTQRTATRQES